MEASVRAGEARDSGAAFGDSATSDKEDVPGLCFIFFDGDGESVGPGVTEALLTFDFGSSVTIVRSNPNKSKQIDDSGPQRV